MLERQRREALKRDQHNRTREELLQESRDRCKTLVGFIREAWHVLEPRAEFILSPHIELICAHLEAVTRGEITRLIIEIPPGCMKSLIVSVFWPAWEWAMGYSTYRYLCTSYEKTLTDRDNDRCKALIESDWYQERWPLIELTTAGVYSFQNTATGWRLGAPFASLMGKRGDRLIIDDPLSVKTVEYKNQLAEVTRLFREGALSRLNSLTKSAMVGIWQCTGPRDIGRVWREVVPDTVVVMLPMTFEKSRRCVTRWGADWRKEEGELLEPIRFPREAVEAQKKGLGPHAYAAQYQQRPTAREGGMFQRKWFDGKIIDRVPADAKITRRVRKWDLAASAPSDSTDPDFTVGLKMSTDDTSYYIENVNRFQKSAHEVRKEVKATAEIDGKETHIHLNEDPGQAGKEQAQSYIAMLAGWRVRADRETGDKGTRAEPFADQCEAGNVYLVRGAWNEEFIDELCAFPKGHDDQVDGGAGAFNYLSSRASDGFFDIEKLRFRGQPVTPPRLLDSVFAVMFSGVKTGRDNDSAGIVYFGRRKVGGNALTILDWDLAPVGTALSEQWLKRAVGRLVELARPAQTRPLGIFVINKETGAVVYQHGARWRLPILPINDAIANIGIAERATAVAAYLERDLIKIAQPADDKVIDFGGQTRNFLLDHIETFRIDEKKDSKEPGDLLCAFLLGVVLALGNPEGY